MRAPAITHVAFGAALALHAVLLAVQMSPRLPVGETPVRIAIRLLAPTEPTPAAEPPRPVPARPVFEKEIQKQPAPPPAARPLPKPTPVPLDPLPVAATPAPIEPSAAAEPAVVPEPAPVAAVAAVAPVVPAAVEPLPAPLAPPVRAENQMRLAGYLDSVRTQVESHKDYPAFARQLRHQGTVVVRVQIGPDGRLRATTLLTSSGHTTLDKAALSAVRNAGRFRPPADFGLTDVSVDIPISYKLI